MINPRLTLAPVAAKFASMHGGRRIGRWRVALLPVVGAMALSGCISVKAPDKPIVIELNINIRQEVVYRLAQDAKNTIESNPEIF